MSIKIKCEENKAQNIKTTTKHQENRPNSCYKCNKMYFESPLISKDNKIQCISCNYKFKDYTKIEKIFIYLNAVFAFNMLDFIDRIVVYLVIFIGFFSIFIEIKKNI